MTIRAVVFDVGGVLIRSDDLSAHKKWEAQLGVEDGQLHNFLFSSEDAERAFVGQISEDELFRDTALRLHLTDEQHAELMRDFWAGERVDTQLIEFVRSLRPRYKTALVSNAWSRARESFVRQGICDVMDDVIISAEVCVMKPDPRIFQIAAERLHVQPSECIFVDDKEINLQGARAVGMKTIQFHSTEQCIRDIQSILTKDEGRRTKAG